MQKNIDITEQGRFVIALDGPSASGKGTVAKIIAREYNLIYYQSSIPYRYLAYHCIQKNIDTNNIPQICAILDSCNFDDHIEERSLSGEDVAAVASWVASFPEVRAVITEYLKIVIKQHSRIIMEGRDIGSVVAPNADRKIFLIADVKSRAERRYKQLLSQGKECILHEILQQLESRDFRDQTRPVGALAQTKDAYVIDSSNLSVAQVVEEVKKIISLPS